MAEGYRVETAADGNTAVQRATGEPFDVIILDVMLPGPRRLRRGARPSGSRACKRPILMLTARERRSSIAWSDSSWAPTIT